jgi:hypothetical protein
VELREKCWLDAVAGLVAGPKTVAKRLDDVIGRNTDMTRSLLQHLEHGPQHAAHGAKRTVLALVEATQAVELPE